MAGTRFVERALIAPRVYWLRSLGCRVFALVDRDVTLIDVGLQGSAPVILRQLHHLGYRPDQVRRIVLTHFHIDHAAGAAELARTTGAEVLAHADEAPCLSGCRPYPNPLMIQGIERPVTWAYNHLMPHDAPATEVQDGDELPVLGGLRVHHTPGHTPGSVVYELRDFGLLFTGDLLQYRLGRLMGPSTLFSGNMGQARESIRRLSALDFDSLCFSHFSPLRHGAPQRLRQLAASWPAAGQPAATAKRGND